MILPTASTTKLIGFIERGEAHPNDQHAAEFEMEVTWYFEELKGGGRVGPVGADDIKRRIDEGEIARETLLWNPELENWTKAGSSSEFRHLFAATPPPLPPSSLRESAIYLMATLPLWAAVYEYAISAWLSGNNDYKFEIYYVSRYWWIGTALLNSVLAQRDEANNEKAGINIAGATALAFFLAPVYIFVRCRAVQRLYALSIVRSYLPLFVWIASIVGRALWEGYRTS